MEKDEKGQIHSKHKTAVTGCKSLEMIEKGPERAGKSWKGQEGWERVGKGWKGLERDSDV